MTDDPPATAWLPTSGAGDEPYPFWLPPVGHGSTSAVVRYRQGASTADDVRETVKRGGEKGHAFDYGTADAEHYLETLAVINAMWGYTRSPDGDPEDQHPYDALRAVRGLKRAAANLQTHPLTDHTDALAELPEVDYYLDDVLEDLDREFDHHDLPTPEQNRDTDH